MHATELLPNNKVTDDPKSTLDIVVTAARLVEDSPPSCHLETSKRSDEEGGVESCTAAAVGGHGTAASAAEPMQIEPDHQEQDGNGIRIEGDDIKDVEMEEAGEMAKLDRSKNGGSSGTVSTGKEGEASTKTNGDVKDGEAGKAISSREGASSTSEIKTKDKNATNAHNDAAPTKAAENSDGGKKGSSMANDSKAIASPKASTSPKGSNSPKSGANASNKGSSKTNNGAAASGSNSANASAAQPPPPVMKGTLSYELEQKRHLIRGMWNYENSNVFPPQRFELLRTLRPEEDPKVLPTDGEFHGSFSLAYFHTTSKGKQKERSKVISESGVNIKFTPIPDKEREYKVDGKGTNQFGVFHINGFAKPTGHDGDPCLTIELRKRYEPAPATAQADNSGQGEAKKQKTDNNAVKNAASDHAEDSAPLPPPSQSYPNGIVCLRGKLYKEESRELGLKEVVHRINGMWAAGLDFLLADPQNVRGLSNRFEYEHKSSSPNSNFPVSGRYSGWFDLNNEDGTRTRINERDVVLKFKKNNAGYHNVEGKGSNVFGKYSISGTLTMDHVITIFRHFQPRKTKAPKTVTSAPPPINAPGQARTAQQPAPEMKLKPADVVVPGDPGSTEALEPIKPPENTSYSAVSRGVLKMNEDGSHSCAGKWAVTREHFTNGQVSNFNFRLEAHHAASAMAESKNGNEQPRQFPLDSAMYKGFFQLKKSGSRYQKIVDQQIVMKFRMNTQGSYNVYGKGVNDLGEYNLLGTMVMSGKTGGQVEVYRMYLPKVKPGEPAAPGAPVPAGTAGSTPSAPVKVDAVPSAVPNVAPSANAMPVMPPAPPPGIQRRESTRLVKLPSRLEDDDPSAQLSRTMEKCTQILKFISEKDREAGAFFSEPVDPVALGIPTYHHVIKEPMDLRTVFRRMEAGQIPSPEEFARLVRLVFENAMTFNVDPGHSVHQAARGLLITFNQKYRDVERMVQSIRRAQGADADEKAKKKGKDDKKRKRVAEEPKSLKKQRLEEAQEMAAANASAVAAIVNAAPPTNSAMVTRSEFNMLLNLIQQLQQQVVKTHTMIAEMSPGDEAQAASAAAPTAARSAPAAPKEKAPAPAPEKKKPAKKKPAAAPAAATATAEPAPAPAPAPAEPPAPKVDDSTPLTLDEQELLTETINQLPAEHLGGVIQIIREAAPVGADEDEIDLEIDQLAIATQRKLLRHVSKYVKKKTKPKKKPPKQPAQTKKSTEKAPKQTQAPPKPKPKPKPKPVEKQETSFFSFDGKDSDSDSEDEGKQQAANSSGKGFSATNDFKLSDGLGGLHDEEEDDDDAVGVGMAANWNMSKSDAKSSKKDGDDEDDSWGAAREAAAVQKQREADRKAREEKMKAEAEQAKKKALADAAARGEEIRAQRLEEEENEARLREQKDKEAEEARNKARDALRQQVQSVEQTVDLDAQRDIMKQYENAYLDKDLGSASPSSDFGF